jgi:hypothetical protein
MAVCLWKLGRAEHYESVTAMSSTPQDMLPVWRQMAALERAYDKALVQLQQQRKLRTGKALPEPQPEAEAERETEPEQRKPIQPEYVMHKGPEPAIDPAPRLAT